MARPQGAIEKPEVEGPPREKYALLVGIHHYHDKDRIHGVAQAEEDVSELRDALLDLGYHEDNIVVLLNDQATKTAIEHHLEVFRIDRLQAGDNFLFFFAGHGFSKDGANYIACCDTFYRDLTGTSIELDEVVKDLRSSICTRIQIFLDCCNSEIVLDPTERSLLTHLSDDMMEKALRDAEHLGCFSSCRYTQKSYSSPGLKHGIWTYHLIKALRGEVPELLNKSPLLTASTLQNYLFRAVPLTVRETFTNKRQQTPWYSGSHGHEFLVADLTPIIQKRRAAASSRKNELRDTILSHDEEVPVRSLSGFHGGHKVPERYNDSTEAFVTKIAQDDLSADLDSIFKAIKKRFVYKRTEINVQKPEGESGGSIWTPDFNYSVSVSLLREDTSKAIITRQLSDIRDPTILEEEGFHEIFDDMFDKVRLTFKKRIDVDKFIDSIEDLESPDIDPDYLPEPEYCDLTITGAPGTIRVTDDALELRLPTTQTILEIAKSFQQTIEAISLTGVGSHLALPG